MFPNSQMRKILTVKVWNFSSFLGNDKNYDYTRLWDWSKFISQVDIVVFSPADMILVWEMGRYRSVIPQFQTQTSEQHFSSILQQSCFIHSGSKSAWKNIQWEHMPTFAFFLGIQPIVRSLRIKIQSVPKWITLCWGKVCFCSLYVSASPPAPKILKHRISHNI